MFTFVLKKMRSATATPPAQSLHRHQNFAPRHSHSDPAKVRRGFMSFSSLAPRTKSAEGSLSSPGPATKCTAPVQASTQNRPCPRLSTCRDKATPVWHDASARKHTRVVARAFPRRGPAAKNTMSCVRCRSERTLSQCGTFRARLSHPFLRKLPAFPSASPGSKPAFPLTAGALRAALQLADGHTHTTNSCILPLPHDLQTQVAPRLCICGKICSFRAAVPRRTAARHFLE